MPSAKQPRLTMSDIHLGRVMQGRGFDQQAPTLRQRSEIVKFLDLVETVPGDCWKWRGYINEGGYAYYNAKQIGVYHAHRMSYLLFVGPLVEGMTIDHLCRNKGCVNPGHLEQVTNGVNVRRGKPWTACDRIHPNSPTRIGPRSDGRESCRECQRVRERERRARFAEKQAAAQMR